MGRNWGLAVGWLLSDLLQQKLAIFRHSLGEAIRRGGQFVQNPNHSILLWQVLRRDCVRNQAVILLLQ